MPMLAAEREALDGIARTFGQIGEAIGRFARREGPIDHKEITQALQSIAKSVNDIHAEVNRLSR
jgi:hypothetical protein